MTRVPDDHIKTLKADYQAIKDRFVELRDRAFTKNTGQQWHDDAMTLFVDMRDDLILPMRDVLEDMLELRAALERQHAAEIDGDSTAIHLERQAVKRLVQNGRGVTMKLRSWSFLHKDDPDLYSQMIVKLNEIDGVV